MAPKKKTKIKNAEIVKDQKESGLQESKQVSTLLETPTETNVSEVEQISVERIISTAIQSNVPVETMERLLAMRKDLKAEFAKERFDEAMAQFQGECPVIKKTKAGGKTHSGQVAYYYAPLESIVEQVKDLITKHGFSYLVKTEPKDNAVKVTVIVKHTSGHSESSNVEVPLGTRTGVMSAPQVTASAITFAKRYAFCNAFGILTGDEDNDGADLTQTPQTPLKPQNLPNQAPVRTPISTAQMRKMYAQASNLGNTKEQLEAWIKKVANVDGIEKLTSTQASKFIEAMDKKLVELRKQEEEQNMPDIQMEENPVEDVDTTHEGIENYPDEIK